MRFYLAAVALSLTLTLVRGQGDLTRVPGTMGADVVAATLLQLRESCVFPNDYQFLRRAAYVLSKDGTDPNTYAIGVEGGIWQITQADFAQTQSSAAVAPYWAGIKSSFNIDWASVRWSDLRKPLYSAIAAMLTLIRVSGGNIPRLAEYQAGFWQNNFFPNDPRAASEFLSQVQNLDVACATNNLDMAFLVDSSTSLTPEEFTRAKTFASDVTAQFTVGPNDVRVAFMTYSSGYRAHFDFQRYTAKNDVQQAIMAVQKAEGGTDTHLALKYAADNLFTVQAGSRPSAARVVIVITDGKSVDRIESDKSAADLRAKGVTVFVIGVGNDIDQSELNSLASAPACTHVQELERYSELDSLKAEIKELSCTALATLDIGVFTFPCGQKSNFQIQPAGVRSIVIRPTTGSVRIYGSHSTVQPSDALSEFSLMATTAKAAVIYIKDATRPLYISVQSDVNRPGECSTSYQIDVVDFNALNKDSENVCVKNDVSGQCTTLDVLMGTYTVTNPTNLGFPFQCDASRPGFYSHPYSSYRFVYCSIAGQAYLVDCPSGYYYNDQFKDCVKGAPPTPPPATQPPRTMPPSTPRPATAAPSQQPIYTVPPGGTTIYPLQAFPICTLENFKLGLHFFEYPANETQYIMCSEYVGIGRLKDCAPYHKWSQVSQACIYKDIVLDWTRDIYQTTPLPVNYGCVPNPTDDSQFYHPHPYDNNKFIQCDEFGDAFVLDCPDNEIWSQTLQNCIPGIRKITSG